MRLHLELEDRVVSDESNRASIIDVPACAKLKPGVRFVHESPNPFRSASSASFFA